MTAHNAETVRRRRFISRVEKAKLGVCMTWGCREPAQGHGPGKNFGHLCEECARSENGTLWDLYGA